jgi:hypothetical protein
MISWARSYYDEKLLKHGAVPLRKGETKSGCDGLVVERMLACDGRENTRGRAKPSGGIGKK